jgi:hypothetical protein
MRRMLLASMILVAGFAAQAFADRGPPVEMTTNVNAQEMHVDISGRIVASKPCRRDRSLHILNRKLDGTTRDQGAFHATGKTGKFRGQAEFLYQGGGNSGDVSEGGGTIVFTFKAQRTRPLKGRFHHYNCPRIVHMESVQIPPDPYAAEP